MKPKSTLRSFFILAGSSLLAVSFSSAATYYWDTNGNVGGFGALDGIWGTSAFWSTSSAGTAVPANTTITNLDDINFGTLANAYSGTVTLTGDKVARGATFAGSSNVVLKGNGTARRLTLGSGGLTMNGTSTVTMGDGVAGNNLLIGLGAFGQTWTNNTANNLSILNTAATFTRSAGGTIAFNGTGGFLMSTTVLPNEVSGIVGPWAFFGTGTSTRYAFNNSGTIAGYSGGTAAADADAFTSSSTNYDFSTTGTTTLTASRTANTIRYDSTGNTIDLGASGADTLTTNGILAVGASGTLTIQRTGGTGTLVAGSTGTNSELVIAGPQNISISAPISNGIGNSTLTYRGTGTLTLSGANTYTGANTVSSGTLVLGSASALGTTGKALNVNGSGTLDLNDFDYTFGAFNGDRASAIVTNSSGNFKLLTVGTGNAAGDFAGAITGNLNLTKVGSASLILRGNNTFTGDVVVNGGTFNPTANNNFVNITVNGSTLTSGGSDVGSGTLGANGGTITFTGTSSYNPQRSNNLSVLSYNKNINISSGTTTFNQSTQYYKEAFTGVLSGSGTIVKNDSNGTLAFSNAANTFTGAIRLDNGSGGIQVNSLADSANAITFNGNTGALSLGAGTATSLLFSSRQIVLANNNGGEIANNNATNSNTITINTNLGFSNTGTRTLELGGTNTGANAFNGLIGNNGASATSITKAGGGTWILSNTANSYTGVTNITGGTLGFVSGALGTVGAINASGGTLLWLPGNTEDISSRLAMTAATTSTFNTNGNNVTFASAIGSSTTGNFVKTGLGTLTLQGTNTFTTGTSAISGGGTLLLDYATNDNRKLPSGALSLAAGTIVLKGGTTTAETASSTTFNTGNNGTFFVRDGGTAKINLNAITVGAQSVLSFSHDSMATTDRTNVAGILGAWFTVGDSWAANATNAADGNIVKYTGATPFNASSTNPDVNYELQGGDAAAGGRSVNTLRIVSTADDQSMNLGTGTLFMSNFTGTNALANTSGGLLYAGGANGNYTISSAVGTTGSGLRIENQNGQAMLVNVYSGTLTVNAYIGSGTSAFVKSGEGTLVLGYNNSGLGGDFRVYQGTVLVNNTTGSGTGSGNVTVNNGASLGGTGTVGGNVTIAARGGLTFDLTTASGSHDKLELAATKTLTFSGTSTLTITSSGGTPGIGTYTLLTAPGGITGSVPTVILPGGWTGTASIAGNDLLLNVTSVGGGGPGPLDHFAISAISSPQTVGTPITGIMLTAQDASNVTVNFTGTVNFGGTGGFSGTSATFTAGVLSGVSVIPTNAGSGLTFMVTDLGSGKTGSTTITTIQTQYEAWAGGAPFDGDANGDGVKNGLAFLLGASGPNVSALDKLPTVTHSSGNLVLNFKCLNTAKRGSAVLKVQYSNDLGITDLWTSHFGDSAVVPGTAPTTVTLGGVDFVSSAFDADKNNMQATIPVSAASPGTKLFGRLKAEQP